MDTTAVSLCVDHDNCQITLRCLRDLDAESVKGNILAAYTDTKTGYQFDWLVDLSALTVPLSDSDNVELGRVWQRMAKGRDVGRRTAFVTPNPVMQSRLRQSQAASAYRAIGVFDTVEAAQAWLKNLVDPALGDGIQLI